MSLPRTSFNFGANKRRRRRSRFQFHGAYKSKARAREKEKERGGFIISRRIRGDWRYVVMTPKGKRK